MKTRSRFLHTPPRPPPPPPPTPEERAAAIAEAEAALADAADAVLKVRVELDEMRHQQAEVKRLRTDLDRFVAEKRALEERLRLVLQSMPDRDSRAHDDGGPAAC